jgi:ABC-type phosphate transport system substrate-binding protein
VVVVNKDNPVEQLSRSELIDLFMGKYVAFPNDIKAIPVELNSDHQIKVEFYQNLVGMPLSRVNAYWSRLRFTGRKRAAVFTSNENDLIAFIVANKQAIGYVPQSLITKDLKVVYILNE